MSTLQLAALILAGEFALVAWVILFLMLRRRRHQEQDDEVHAGAVMEHLEAHETTHRDALASLFETTYNLEGEALAAKVDEYMERERAFYNMMLNLYLNRDGAKLKEIPAELAKVIKPWAEMTPVGMINASDVTSLENERAQLSTELENTKETLEQLMEEYMAAFKKAEQQQAEAPPPPPALEPAPGLPAREPEAVAQAPEPDEEADLEELDMDAGDFDIQPAESPPEDEPAEPTPEPPAESESSFDEALDPSDIDAMLEALAKEAVGEQEPAPAKPDEESERPLSPEEIEEARARDELEGLADLFDLPSEAEEPTKKP
ncbi:hypothetical protein HW932_01460 [Allochromatium humboldtianum]|uniref:Uncharacterized protein n=1 Tax=Allochromatium humboldtianum TaxID=504901 RepID=A0A850R3K4_9GAMM|nr:hypothetical protein [Allochromatium humboldtianum]NVZ07928.1 hypothetical protein [Allochromatium humboldtianum]